MHYLLIVNAVPYELTTYTYPKMPTLHFTYSYSTKRRLRMQRYHHQAILFLMAQTMPIIMAFCTVLINIILQNIEARDTMMPPSTFLCTQINFTEVWSCRGNQLVFLKWNPSLVNRINSIIAKTWRNLDYAEMKHYRVLYLVPVRYLSPRALSCLLE